jgi:hypothetical protein
MATTLEDNNIKTQVKLMGDIISNYNAMHYGITQKGKELRELCATKKINEEEKTVTFSKDVFNKILDIAYILQDESKWEDINSSTKRAVPDNCVKIEILKLLQSK